MTNRAAVALTLALAVGGLALASGAQAGGKKRRVPFVIPQAPAPSDSAADPSAAPANANAGANANATSGADATGGPAPASTDPPVVIFEAAPASTDPTACGGSNGAGCLPSNPESDAIVQTLASFADAQQIATVNLQNAASMESDHALPTDPNSAWLDPALLRAPASANAPGLTPLNGGRAIDPGSPGGSSGGIGGGVSSGAGGPVAPGAPLGSLGDFFGGGAPASGAAPVSDLGSSPVIGGSAGSTLSFSSASDASAASSTSLSASSLPPVDAGSLLDFSKGLAAGTPPVADGVRSDASALPGATRSAVEGAAASFGAADELGRAGASGASGARAALGSVTDPAMARFTSALETIDPLNYFERTRSAQSLFAIVEERYRVTAARWSGLVPPPRRAGAGADAADAKGALTVASPNRAPGALKSAIGAVSRWVSALLAQ